MALGAIEALLVPHRSLSELLLSGKDHSATAGAALASWSLDRGCVWVVERTALRYLLLTIIRASRVRISRKVSFRTRVRMEAEEDYLIILT